MYGAVENRHHIGIASAPGQNLGAVFLFRKRSKRDTAELRSGCLQTREHRCRGNPLGWSPNVICAKPSIPRSPPTPRNFQVVTPFLELFWNFPGLARRVGKKREPGVTRTLWRRTDRRWTACARAVALTRHSSSSGRCSSASMRTASGARSVWTRAAASSIRRVLSGLRLLRCLIQVGRILEGAAPPLCCNA